MVRDISLTSKFASAARLRRTAASYKPVPAREAEIDEANRARRAAEFDELKSLLAEDQAYRGRQQEKTLTSIKQALAATRLAYADVDPELKARQILDASGLSGRAGAYEEILAAVKATMAQAKVQQFLDVYEALDRPGWPDPPAPTGLAKKILDAKALADAGGHEIPPPPPGSLAAQIIEARRKNREGEGSK